MTTIIFLAAVAIGSIVIGEIWFLFWKKNYISKNKLQYPI